MRNCTCPEGRSGKRLSKNRALQAFEGGGDIQATTKVADCRSLQSSPPKIFEISSSNPGFRNLGFEITGVLQTLLRKTD